MIKLVVVCIFSLNRLVSLRELMLTMIDLGRNATKCNSESDLTLDNAIYISHTITKCILREIYNGTIY